MSAALLPAVLAACGDGATDDADGGRLRPDAATEPAAQLELLTEPSLTLLFGESDEFRVRYTEQDGRPIAGALVGLALVGRAHDSSLASLDATTDEDGIASGQLTAGSVPAAFTIRVSAERALPVGVDVSVGNAGFGGLRVTVLYDGERLITERAVHVFTGMACDDPRARAESGDRVKTLFGSETEARFFALPAGVTYAVVARGRGPGGEMLAWGCADSVEILADSETDAAVLMDDLALVVDGEYSVESEIRAADAMAALVSRVRTAGDDAIAAAGGDGALMLDAIEAILRSSGLVTAADDLAIERIDAGLEAELEGRFGIDGVGPSVAVEDLALLLEERADHVAITGLLAIVDGIPAWSMRAVSARSGAPDPARLALDLGAVGVEPVASIAVTWLLDEDAMRLDVLRMLMPLGSIGRAAFAAVAAERRVDGLPGVMLPGAGCATLQSWAAERPVIDTACDGACVLMACKNAIERVATPITEALDALNAERAIITLTGRVTLTDREGDLRVDALSSEALSGEWTDPANTESDLVSGTLRGVRTIE